MKKAKKILCKLRKNLCTACKYIINTITVMMGILFLVSACAVDSESNIPLICCIVSFCWCAVYLYLRETFDGELVVIDDDED